MQQNYLTYLSQAITELLTTRSAAIQATGLDIFRGLAVILIVWFGIKAALSASQGGGGFNFAKFADLILMIAFGLGMLTYYSTPVPGIGYSFSGPRHQRSHPALRHHPVRQRPADRRFHHHRRNTTWQSSRHVQLLRRPDLSGCPARPDGHAGIRLRRDCLRLCRHGGLCADRPHLHPMVHRAEDGLALLGMVQAFIGFSFYQVVASAFIFIFSKVVIGMFSVIGTLSLSNIVTLLPALVTLMFVCVYGLHKIPELTASILGGRSGTWADPSGK